jgi:hypothetical protein
MLDPADNTGKEPRRNPALQRRFATLTAQPPGGVSADHAACDRGRGEQPGIAIVRDEPKQEKVGTAGYGQGDNRGIYYGDQKKAQRTQVD